MILLACDIISGMLCEFLPYKAMQLPPKKLMYMYGQVTGGIHNNINIHIINLGKN